MILAPKYKIIIYGYNVNQAMTITNQLRGAIQAASYNILLQIFLRAQTFGLNAFIIRFIAKETLGIINVRLLLLYSTVIFLSREAFHNACLSNTKERKWHQVINQLWLMVPTAILWSVVLGYLWVNVLEQPDLVHIHQYRSAVWVICGCVVMEMIGEPLFVIARIFLFNKLKVFSECLGIAIRCATLATVVYLKPEYTIIGFAVGQVLCSFTFTIMAYGYFAYYFRKKNTNKDFPFQSMSDFLPQILPHKDNLSKPLLRLTWSFFKQGILKQVLTEGERYVMTIFDLLTFAEQGVFDVVNNLGSMAARFMFRPVEESCYQFFAGTIKRDIPVKQQNKDDIATVVKVFKNVLKMMIHIGLVFLAFGNSYASTLLHIYGGSVLSTGIGPLLLRAHCGYVLLLGVNGITECFYFAVMGKDDVERYNSLLVAMSFSFLFTSWFLTKMLGSVGFILANCANMAARIFCSCRFVRKYLSDGGYNFTEGLCPKPLVLFTLCTSFVITKFSEMTFGNQGLVAITSHVSIGATCFAILLLTIVKSERDLLIFFRGHFMSNKQD